MRILVIAVLAVLTAATVAPAGPAPEGSDSCVIVEIHLPVAGSEDVVAGSEDASDGAGVSFLP